MQSVTRSFGMLWDALFLQRDAYARMRDDDNPFVEGLFILVILGLVLAVFGIIGTTLEWASSPPLAAIKDAVYGELQRMPWWQAMEQSPQAVAQFQSIWDQVWRVVNTVSPSPARSLADIITKPLGLIIGWLIYGVVAYLLARLLGGRGKFDQTLGATALAAAPQMLYVFTVLPFAAVAGISTWTLLCNYMALRTVHDLSWPRAMWAALLPPILLALVIGIIAGVFGVIFGAGLAAMLSGGMR